MDFILFTFILVASIVACAAAKDFSLRKNIQLPRTGVVIGHLVYGILLVLAYIYL